MPSFSSRGVQPADLPGPVRPSLFCGLLQSPEAAGRMEETGWPTGSRTWPTSPPFQESDTSARRSSSLKLAVPWPVFRAAFERDWSRPCEQLPPVERRPLGTFGCHPGTTASRGRTVASWVSAVAEPVGICCERSAERAMGMGAGPGMGTVRRRCTCCPWCVRVPGSRAASWSSVLSLRWHDRRSVRISLVQLISNCDTRCA